MANTTEIAWMLEGPRRGGIRRFVGNPHGEPRYVEGSMGAHKFATEADAEAARPRVRRCISCRTCRR